ncbi:hypothetical protein D3C79_1047060 [compost metagenome]
MISLNDPLIDPSGCIWDSGGNCGSGSLGVAAKAYMKATCLKDGKKVTYVLARLESVPGDSAAIDNMCDSGKLPGFSGPNEYWGTRYGMNYFVTVK